MGTSKVEETASQLWKNETDENWSKFQKALKGSGIKFYKVVFDKSKKLRKASDLTSSYAELYDAKEKLVTKVPIFKKEKGKIVGATIYLKELTGLNRWN